MSDQINIKTQFEMERLLSRSQLYGVLAFLFRHPLSIENNFSVRKERYKWKQALNALDYPDKDQLEKSLELLLKELNNIDFQRWTQQYEDCFAHTAHGVVPSYELEYGEEHTHRQPQQLGDIAAFYNAFGLKVNDKVHERVDHVAVECEFMQFLLYKEAYALKHDGAQKAEICRKASHRFLAEHLGRWVPAFALRLSKHRVQGLMKKIADFAFTFVVQECQQFGILPGSYDLPIRVIQEKEDAGCVTCSLNPGFSPNP
jgi:putative dimethyl sulfoxide reductase chaperone